MSPLLSSVQGTRGGAGFYSLLDQLRGIAALLVVWAHLVGYFLEASGRSWLPYSLVNRFIQAPLAIVESFGWFGVALFFFISGFVITHAASRETGREFIVKRLLRIYPPLVFAVLLALVVDWLGHNMPAGSSGPGLSFWDVFANFSLVNYAAAPRAVILVVAWTLAVEMSFYLIMWGLKKLIPRFSLLLSPAVLALVVVLMLLSGPSPAVFFLTITTGFLPVLVLGQICYLVATKRVSLPVGALYGIAAWVIFILSLERTYPQNLVPTYSYPANAMLAFLLFLAAILAEGRVRPLRGLSVLAKRSYSLYLVHGPLGLTILGLLAVGTTIPYTVELIIALAAVAAATEVCYRFVERPTQRLGRRLFPRQTRPAVEAPVAPGVP
jgi:peptidoglycan/LPS O-acetylase OafA/YrhL